MSHLLPEPDSQPPEVQPTHGAPLIEGGNRPVPPPLRIHHILVVTAVAAVLLSVGQQIKQHDLLGLSYLFGSSWGAIFTIATAISLTLVMFGSSWRRSGYAFFDLPGHWLLVSQSLSVGLFLAVAIALAIRAVGDGNDHMLPIFIYFSGSQLLLLLLNAWAAWKIADSLSWRLYFLLEFCEIVLLFLVLRLVTPTTAFTVVRVLPYVSLFALLIAAVADRMARRKRDWPHWVGVALPCAICVASWIQMFVG